MDCMYRFIYSSMGNRPAQVCALLSVFEPLKYRDDVFVVIGI
jgi:hypothetical protein